jgi:hypothetical protein
MDKIKRLSSLRSVRIPVANLFFLTCVSIASCVFCLTSIGILALTDQNLTTLVPNPNPNPDPNYKPNPNPNPTINPLFTSFYFLRNGYTG